MEHVTQLDDLGSRVRAHQDALLQEGHGAAEASVAERVVALRAARLRRAPAPSRHRGAVRGAAVLVLAASVTFVLARRPNTPPTDASPLTYTVDGEPRQPEGARWSAPGRWLVPTSSDAVIRFSDGSEVDVRPSSVVRLAKVDAHGATIVLERGFVHTHVVPRKDNVWNVVAGPYRIAVKGTRFDTEWQPEDGRGRLRVAMHEGTVVVTGACLGAGRQLEAGDVGDIQCPSEAPAATQSAAPASALPHALPEPPRAPTASRPTVRAIATTSATAPGQPSSWQTMARSSPREALAAAPIDDVLERGGPEDVMLLAEVARRAGALEVAERAHRVARARFPGTEVAARSTFLLARMLADAQRSVEAESLFAEYAALSPNGVFAQEAASRLLEIARTRGDVAVTKVRARAYLERFPDGPASEIARSELRR